LPVPIMASAGMIVGKPARAAVAAVVCKKPRRLERIGFPMAVLRKVKGLIAQEPV
jgi:hypothetical protein